MNPSSLVRTGDQYAQFGDNGNAKSGCQSGGRRRRGKSGKKTRRRRHRRGKQHGGMCGTCPGDKKKQTGGGGVPTYGYRDGNLSEVYRGSYAPVSTGNTADCPDASKLGVPALEAAGRTPQEVQATSLVGGGRRRRRTRRNRKGRHGKKHGKHSRHNRRSRKSRRNRRSRKLRKTHGGYQKGGNNNSVEYAYGHTTDLNSFVGGQPERVAYSTCGKQ